MQLLLTAQLHQRQIQPWYPYDPRHLSYDLCALALLCMVKREPGRRLVPLGAGRAFVADHPESHHVWQVFRNAWTSSETRARIYEHTPGGLSVTSKRDDVQLALGRMGLTGTTVPRRAAVVEQWEARSEDYDVWVARFRSDVRSCEQDEIFYRAVQSAIERPDDAEATLHRLFASCFSVGEAKRFIRHKLPDARDLANSLTDHHSPLECADVVVPGLLRRGLVDLRLYDALLRERPGRRDEIAVSALLWGIDVTPRVPESPVPEDD